VRVFLLSSGLSSNAVPTQEHEAERMKNGKEGSRRGKRNLKRTPEKEERRKNRKKVSKIAP
jgi:hypothetical protein